MQFSGQIKAFSTAPLSPFSPFSYFYYYDGLGSVAALVDTAGNIA
jgi:hypothetical protein